MYKMRYYNHNGYVFDNSSMIFKYQHLEIVSSFLHNLDNIFNYRIQIAIHPILTRNSFTL